MTGWAKHSKRKRSSWKCKLRCSSFLLAKEEGNGYAWKSTVVKEHKTTVEIISLILGFTFLSKLYMKEVEIDLD